MPVLYPAKTLSRAITMAASALIAGWCVYVLLRHVSAETSSFYKALPLVVLFVALDNLFRSLTSLNAAVFTPEELQLKFILAPTRRIPWANIARLEFRKAVTYYVFLYYTDAAGKERVFKANASFPKMLEIMYNIAELCPKLEMNEELARMVKTIRDIRAGQQ